METMKAIVQHAPFDFRLERVPKPAAGPGEVVLRIEAAGICAGDRIMYQGKAPWGISPGEIPGHEYVGVVEELGEGAAECHGLSLGERCTAEVRFPAGTAPPAERGCFTFVRTPPASRAAAGQSTYGCAAGRSSTRCPPPSTRWTRL